MNIMKKIEFNIVPSVDTCDIINFIIENSNYDHNTACNIYAQESIYMEDNLPDEMKVIVDGIISMVIVNNLNYDGWIKKFTETHNMLQDYYILFTN